MVMNAAYNDTTLSDFSSSLLNFRDEDEGAIVNLSSSDYMSRDNGHLNSVLSQIQDDGPAYDGASRRGKLFSRATNSKRKEHADLANKQDDNSHIDVAQKNGSYSNEAGRAEASPTNEGLTGASLTNAGLTKAGSTKASVTKASNNSAWFQVLLILLITVITALTLFNINLRTSDLEHALNIHDADLQDGSVSVGNGLLPEINKIKAVLKSVQQRMQLIKTYHSVLNEKYKATIEGNITMQTGKGVSIKDNVNDLESEILALKEELYTVKGRLEIKAASENIKPVRKVAVPHGVTVNLASFTNETNAEALVKEITATGLLPEIEKATVRDMQVFRISVSGFSDVAEAELFIRNAGEQYGLKDGRIRKS